MFLLFAFKFSHKPVTGVVIAVHEYDCKFISAYAVDRAVFKSISDKFAGTFYELISRIMPVIIVYLFKSVYIAYQNAEIRSGAVFYAFVQLHFHLNIGAFILNSSKNVAVRHIYSAVERFLKIHLLAPCCVHIRNCNDDMSGILLRSHCEKHDIPGRSVKH